MDLNSIFWIIVGFGIPGLIAYFLTFQTRKITSLYAKTYRFGYKEFLHLSDEEIRRLPSKWIGGPEIESMVSLIERGGEHPDEFPQLIAYFRNLGQILWSIVLSVAALFFFLLLSGGFQHH